jgi:hypothetical protein
MVCASKNGDHGTVWLPGLCLLETVAMVKQHRTPLLNHVSCCSRGCQKAKPKELAAAKRRSLLLPKGQEGAAAEELVVAEELAAAKEAAKEPTDDSVLSRQEMGPRGTGNAVPFT